MCLVAAATVATTATAAEATAVTAAAEAATITTAETTATTTAAEAAAAWRTCFHWTCFVHDQVTTAKALAVHAFDSSLCFSVRTHFHKAEALGTAGVTFHHDLGAGDGTELAESAFQIAVTERVRQVAHVKFVAHLRTPKKVKKAMEPDAINKPVTTSKTDHRAL